ncbi:kinetochore Sim4 complex subunit FTA2-domain-containing protein [Podospora didyma]|uniref:Kinetochore Sim4 complex subunit FTA2-domain-containing protein n=1 Tax=Podospora didyma TaxID=330526 RepID=A0AAE0P801_9PEZI|nr:kinetochore Sim4 complex subunit FTA2-domain-containing protein [Podospora didyma]
MVSVYTDWPKSAADLLPLPDCDGPKLRPFDFRGQQNIQFLEHIGDGAHADVFRVNIGGQIYALKVFRFGIEDRWMAPEHKSDYDSPEAARAFYNYSEPFCAECRAYGRLQEAGHEDLSIQCFGYVLLDEKHEDSLMKQFPELRHAINGNYQTIDSVEIFSRKRFLGKDGRPPPIRCLVKEFGHECDALQAKDAKQILKDIIRLHQLGIIDIDIADRQIINGKIGDFSTAITVPHYLTTPALNPHLAPEWISAMEKELFVFSSNDYWVFDAMVDEVNQELSMEHDEEHDEESGETQNSIRKKRIEVFAFPPGKGNRPTRYDLRGTTTRARLYTLADPRRYNWRDPVKRGNSRARPEDGSQKPHQRLQAQPPRWYLDFSRKEAERLRQIAFAGFTNQLAWTFKEGHIFPTQRPQN